ncbi:MAG: lipopolysaccharide heptosyltransferase II [Verrucomicrobiota bacterium]|nr:lipopolysaccharide heptosyltransferase II [Verrucomicrobiota bacterium]
MIGRAGKITLAGAVAHLARGLRMLDFSTYLLYRAAALLVSFLPLGFLFSLGKLLGLVGWTVFGKYRRLALHNLTIAFGREKSPAELRQLSRRHFATLGANLLCSIKFSSMSIEQIAARVTVENEDVVHAEFRAGRGVAILLTHIGSWELSAQVVPREFHYIRSSTVYQPLGNRFIDAAVQRQRARLDVTLFDRRAGFQGPIELLRAGGLVGILADQHAGDHGLWTPLFGRLASSTPLPALIAKRTHSALIGAAVYTVGHARWRMEFTSPIACEGVSIEAITARVNTMVEELIRRAPEDWFWVHNRWKTPKPNFLLTNYKRPVYLPEDMSASELQPFRILVRGTNWLGDSVISAAAVRALKLGRPDAHITVAAPAKFSAVWKLVPEVDEVLPLPGKSLWRTVRLLRAHKPFEVAVLFPNSLRSALEVWLAGIPRRVGFAGHRRRWLLNQIVPPPAKPGPPQHQVHHYLRIVRHLGGPADLIALPQPRRAPTTPGGVVKLGLCAGAEYGPAKRWLPERFAEVASAVAAAEPVQWQLFGTAADAAVGESIATQLGESCVNRIGKTSLDELIAELRECRLLLTNDTGTMHLATLLGVPVVAVFGSTEPRLTGPLGTGNAVIRHHVECSPCFLRKCPIDFRCMHAVSAKEVTAQVLAMLTRV